MIAEMLTCIALNVYYEARSEPMNGQYAVAHVVLNRVADDSFPDDACKVVKQGYHKGKHRCQFSWYCDGKSDAIRNEKKFNKIVEFSRYFINDYYHKDHVDITDGALFYHASWMEKYPKWSKTKRKLAQFDSHIFYR